MKVIVVALVVILINKNISSDNGVTIMVRLRFMLTAWLHEHVINFRIIIIIIIIIIIK